MEKSLLRNLNEKDLKAIVATMTPAQFYHQTLFPYQKNNTLTYKGIMQSGGFNLVAADVISRGATIERKTREALAEIYGDIPKIAISREMKEDQLTEYDIALELAKGSADLTALVKRWADDVEFCYNGVNAKIEAMALASISTGKLKLTSQNNVSVMSEFDLDYQLDSDQKRAVTTSWASGTSAKPLSVDIKEAVKVGRKQYKTTYKYMLMTPETFALMAKQEEVIKLCSSALNKVMKIDDTPTTESVNAYMANHPELYYGLQIKLIDQQVTYELADHTFITENPFHENVILFSNSLQVGTTFYKTPIDLNVDTPAMKAMNGAVLIQKYSEIEPLKEMTAGIANAFPVWTSAATSALLQVNNTSWNIK